VRKPLRYRPGLTAARPREAMSGKDKEEAELKAAIQSCVGPGEDGSFRAVLVR
jgi:hypothetical protein